jgi:glycosyltransferase involved in cell wall biosynthesis
MQDQVTFAGKLVGAQLATLINKHRIMVVPSRNEGFGIVALEGIACGCVMVGSDAGGIPEAIGECGLIFRNGDVEDLSRALSRALTDNALADRVGAARAAHLACFSRREVARRFIDVIKDAAARAGSR